MAKYIAWLEQNGEGCDYTIGCGQALCVLKATTKEDAVLEVEKMIVETVCDEQGAQYKSAIIYDVSNTYRVHVPTVYSSEKDRRAGLAQARANHEEKKLYEKLKAKYEQA